MFNIFKFIGKNKTQETNTFLEKAKGNVRKIPDRELNKPLMDYINAKNHEKFNINGIGVISILEEKETIIKKQKEKMKKILWNILFYGCNIIFIIVVSIYGIFIPYMINSDISKMNIENAKNFTSGISLILQGGKIEVIDINQTIEQNVSSIQSNVTNNNVNTNIQLNDMNVSNSISNDGVSTSMDFSVSNDTSTLSNTK